MDPGESTHRTVFTFVGGPESIVEGALNAAKAAFPLIDMKQHQGEHPRMGALDVCPFIPVQDVSVEECVQLAKQFGRRLAQELGVPVYLYGAASEKDYRKTMPQVSKKLNVGYFLRSINFPSFGAAKVAVLGMMMKASRLMPNLNLYDMRGGNVWGEKAPKWGNLIKGKFHGPQFLFGNSG